MHSSSWLVFSALASAVVGLNIRGDNASESLIVTALVGKNNASSLECWSLCPNFTISESTGTVGALAYPYLGATVNGSYARFTALSNAGIHNAPAPQYVFIMTGSGELSFPSSDPSDPSNTTLSGNYTLLAGDILMAVDTADVSVTGHNTVWQEGSVALQLPFADGVVPDHEVLYDGGCVRDE